MHHKEWIEKYKANTISSVLDLKYFPPTLETIRLNVKRAHFQCYLWRNVKVAMAVELKVDDFGWPNDTTSKCLELYTSFRAHNANSTKPAFENNILWML